jgi:hypothetical protein
MQLPKIPHSNTRDPTISCVGSANVKTTKRVKVMAIKSLILGTAILFTASAAFACPGGGTDCMKGTHEESSGMGMHGMKSMHPDKLAKLLELDEARAAQVAELYEKHQAERQALHEKYKSDLDEILTDEEMAKVEQMHMGKGHHSKSDPGKKNPI